MDSKKKSSSGGGGTGGGGRGGRGGRREKGRASRQEEGGREGERAGVEGKLPSGIASELIPERQGEDVMATQVEGGQGEGGRGEGRGGGRGRRSKYPTDKQVHVRVAPVGVGREEVVSEKEAEDGLESGRTRRR